MLVAVGILFIIYAVVDHRNHLYANIVLTAVDGILFLYLGQAATVGAVAFISASTGDIMNMFGWISFGYCLIMAYEAANEAIQQKKAGETGPVDGEMGVEQP